MPNARSFSLPVPARRRTLCDDSDSAPWANRPAGVDHESVPLGILRPPAPVPETQTVAQQPAAGSPIANSDPESHCDLQPQVEGSQRQSIGRACRSNGNRKASCESFLVTLLICAWLYVAIIGILAFVFEKTGITNSMIAIIQAPDEQRPAVKALAELWFMLFLAALMLGGVMTFVFLCLCCKLGCERAYSSCTRSSMYR